MWRTCQRNDRQRIASRRPLGKPPVTKRSGPKTMHRARWMTQGCHEFVGSVHNKTGSVAIRDELCFGCPSVLTVGPVFMCSSLGCLLMENSLSGDRTPLWVKSVQRQVVLTSTIQLLHVVFSLIYFFAPWAWPSYGRSMALVREAEGLWITQHGLEHA